MDDCTMWEGPPGPPCRRRCLHAKAPRIVEFRRLARAATARSGCRGYGSGYGTLARLLDRCSSNQYCIVIRIDHGHVDHGHATGGDVAGLVQFNRVDQQGSRGGKSESARAGDDEDGDHGLNATCTMVTL
jgi:hypothetical protein